ncbi:MAG: PQQ-binding-like beta-propeller repeat protein [Myxococcales bacterium]|nr:PQQ-binding-like beta-propeller repeat protein [Myxococcales bacterium]
MSDDDEKMTWRSWAIGLSALAAATTVFFLFMHLRVLFLGVDSVAGFAVRGDQVVVFERVFGGEESVGGDRLVRLDVRTGEVKKRVRADDGEWLGEVDGLVWFKRVDGLEARDFDSLEVKHAAKDLLQKFPELAGIDRFLCSDRLAHAIRFTTRDGRHVRFDLAAQVMSPTDDTGCGSNSVEAYSGTLPDGRTLELRGVPQSTRSELAIKGGEALGSSGLEVNLLVDSRRKQLARVGDDVLFVRRTGNAQDSPTEVVCVSPQEKKERWATSLHDGRLGFEDLVIVDGVIVLGDGHRVFALDAATGALKWKRTP